MNRRALLKLLGLVPAAPLVSRLPQEPVPVPVPEVRAKPEVRVEPELYRTTFQVPKVLVDVRCTMKVGSFVELDIAKNSAKRVSMRRNMGVIGVVVERLGRRTSRVCIKGEVNALVEGEFTGIILDGVNGFQMCGSDRIVGFCNDRQSRKMGKMGAPILANGMWHR